MWYCEKLQKSNNQSKRYYLRNGMKLTIKIVAPDVNLLTGKLLKENVTRTEPLWRFNVTVSLSHGTRPETCNWRNKVMVTGVAEHPISVKVST